MLFRSKKFLHVPPILNQFSIWTRRKRFRNKLMQTQTNKQNKYKYKPRWNINVCAWWWKRNLGRAGQLDFWLFLWPRREHFATEMLRTSTFCGGLINLVSFFLFLSFWYEKISNYNFSLVSIAYLRQYMGVSVNQLSEEMIHALEGKAWNCPQWSQFFCQEDKVLRVVNIDWQVSLSFIIIIIFFL